MNPAKITPDTIRALKARGEKIAALTAYDYPTTKLLDECGVPLLLVGDSLGMVVLGYPDTTRVTMAEMEHHTRAAARARPNALLGADLPFHAYETPDEAVANARRLIAAGAEYVKAEGGREILPQIQAILGAGIPFVGHLGMLPQHVLEEGGSTASRGAMKLVIASCWTMPRRWPGPARLPSCWNWSRRSSPAKSPNAFPSPPSASARGRTVTGRFW